MPDMEHLLAFIKENYPIEEDVTEELLESYLLNIIQKIGDRNVLAQPEELVVLKLINETNDINDYWKNGPKSPEIQYLLAKSVL